MLRCYFLMSILLVANAMSAQTFPNIRVEQGLSLPSRQIAQSLRKETITTSFSDVDTTQPLPIWFGDTMQAVQISTMPRTDSGAYILSPGFYEMDAQSYCIKAGTYGPSQGDGYGWARLKGPKEDLMRTLLINAQHKKSVKQQDIQLLLWAIIARTRFHDLNLKLQAIAVTLLNPKDILRLNSGAIGFVPKHLLNRATDKLPPVLTQILRAENEMRRMFSNANAVYGDFERLAVLSGMAPVDRPDIKRGRWSKHPCGYYIRYLPAGYNKTRVQVFVPGDENQTSNPCKGEGTNSSGETIIGVIFNAIGSVAVPANTGSQRLLQSNESFPLN